MQEAQDDPKEKAPVDAGAFQVGPVRENQYLATTGPPNR